MSRPLTNGILEFNFWPSFADLMLALVLILFLVIFASYAVITEGLVNLSSVQSHQFGFLESVAREYKTMPVRIDSSTFTISTGANEEGDIVIMNEPTIQHVRFSANVLFQKDSYDLRYNGRKILRTVGELIRKQLPAIHEIQIQGHADITPTTKFRSNLELAALRAIQVFYFFSDSLGISPVRNLMSATSFGEYKPVLRSESDTAFSPTKLRADNSSERLKALNRRIELLLFYNY